MASKSGLGSTKVRKTRVEYVNIYEVTENELSALENGGQSTLMFEIAISLLSIAITCGVALVTSSFVNDTIKYAFLFAAIACALVGVVLVILGWKGRQNVCDIVKQIKSRPKHDE